MASKNIFSDGYIQFPLELTPDSCSLFAGVEKGSLALSARGMEETTRSVPKESFGGEGCVESFDEDQNSLFQKPGDVVLDAD